MKSTAFLLQLLLVATATGHTPVRVMSTFWSTPQVPVHYYVKVCPVCAPPECPPPPPPKPEVDSEIEDILEFTKKISDTACLLGETLNNIGEIAVNDDAGVGATIVKKLQNEIAQGSELLVKFASQTGASSKSRYKRDVKMDGNTALNKVGDTLVNSNAKIDADMKKLSDKAQKKINKKHRDGINKCLADSCKAAAKILSDTDDESERQ